MRLTPRVQLALALAIYAALAARLWWVCDDAFIAFRYGRNLAEGHGLRFNLGVDPPVEGYTQLGWVLVCALLERVGIAPRVGAPALSFACGALLLAWAHRHALALWGAESRAPVAVALFLAVCPTMSVWATGGLGTMAFALALFATFERLLGTPDAPRPVQAGLCAAVAVVLRADAPYFLAWIGLAALATSDARGRRAAWIFGAIGAAAIVAVFLFRHAVHGDWIPNTARAKVGLSAMTIERGTKYVASWLLTIPAAALVLTWATIAALRGAGVRYTRPVIVVWGVLLYGVLIGGDFMAMGRFFVPAVPLLALLWGWAAHGAEIRWRTSSALAVAAVAVALAVPASFDLRLAPRAWLEAVWFRWSAREVRSEYETWEQMVRNSEDWATLGKALALHTDPSESLVRHTIGGVGYYSRLFLFDGYGLVNRDVVERVEVPKGLRRTPGHDRRAPRRFFDDQGPTWEDAQLVDVYDPAAIPDATRRPDVVHRVEPPTTPRTQYLLLWRGTGAAPR